MTKTAAIIVAAGGGRRFGAVKQTELLRGKPVLDWSLETFNQHPAVDRIILVLREDLAEKKYQSRYSKLSAVVPGGKERQDSVRSGFAVLKSDETDIVLVHDGVRPLVNAALISRVIDEAGRSGAAVPVVSLEDTIKRIEAGVVLGTMDREKLVRVQTPQGFLYDILNTALKKSAAAGFYGTDEAVLVERLGGKVKAVSGESGNLKITRREDLKIAEVLLENQIRNRL